jgi:TatA/E family protein of Tat protein translocase
MFAELLQPTHLIVIAVIVVLLFGGRRIARLGNGFKDAVNNFRNAAGNSKRDS